MQLGSLHRKPRAFKHFLVCVCASFKTIMCSATAHVYVSSLPLEGVFKSYPVTLSLPTLLTWTDSEHLAVDKRSQLRQGSSPRNSIHSEHRTEVIFQTKESTAHQREQTESGSPPLDTHNSTVCSKTLWHVKNKDQRKPETPHSMMSQSLKLAKNVNLPAKYPH